MKKWIFVIDRGTPKTSAEMLFDTPYSARQWLRELSYTYQALGHQTKIEGPAAELVLNVYIDGNSHALTCTLTEQW